MKHIQLGIILAVLAGNVFAMSLFPDLEEGDYFVYASNAVTVEEINISTIRYEFSCGIQEAFKTVTLRIVNPLETSNSAYLQSQTPPIYLFDPETPSTGDRIVGSTILLFTSITGDTSIAPDGSCLVSNKRVAISIPDPTELAYCVEPDGSSIYIAGTTQEGSLHLNTVTSRSITVVRDAASEIRTDTCAGNMLTEYTCQGGVITGSTVSLPNLVGDTLECPSGYECRDHACVSLTGEEPPVPPPVEPPPTQPPPTQPPPTQPPPTEPPITNLYGVDYSVLFLYAIVAFLIVAIIAIAVWVIKS